MLPALPTPNQTTRLPRSGRRKAAGPRSRFETLSDESINSEWAGPADNKSCKAGDIKQDDLITHWSELRAHCCHREELDRTETIRQVHLKHGHQQYSGHWHADNRYECPKQYSKSAE